ncbi:MAG: sigma-70 family RNA polymerase sigma factor [Fibrella sp.]|nr:sigma-70 family RNA polymerase sigma factor [Armatimonadota bacterium]
MIGTITKQGSIVEKSGDLNVGRDDSQVAAYIREYVLRRSGKVAPTASPTLSELKAKIAHLHTPLVESVARRFVGSGEPFEDLVQEGFLGLLSALDNYDPERTAQKEPARKIKFSTYATHFVVGAIRHFLRDRGKIIKEPAWLHEISVKVARTTDALTVELGRAPQSIEIARVLNLTEEAVDEILSTRQTFQVSAFGSSSEDNDSTVGLVDPEKIRSDKHVTLRLPIEDRIVLENAVLKLKELEQNVLFEFFYQDHSQTEIAKQFGISCNYVSHILKNATGKLKRIMGEADVRDRGRPGGASSALTCSSTGLLAPAHTLSRFGEALARSARENRACALIHIQVKGLPERGLRRETLLYKIGDVLRNAIRKVDIAGRAEDCPNDFLLFLPQRNEEQAQETAVKLENLLLAFGAAEGETFLVQVGVATYPVAGRSIAELLAKACSGEQFPIPQSKAVQPLRKNLAASMVSGAVAASAILR